MEKETLYYPDIVACLEPHRSSVDIAREMEELSERRLVGKPPIINLEAITGSDKGKSGVTPGGGGLSGDPSDNAANNFQPPTK
jgi:hypothetical protein